MASNLSQILDLDVPIIVRLGERRMSLGDIVAIIPGTIIELPKRSEEELELLVNNKAVGAGSAVKVGENFGIRVSFIGDLKTRIEAMGPGDADDETGEEDVAAIAAKLLASQ